MQITTDIAIIGSGAGGGTMAYALRNSGATVLLLERGEFLPSEPENASARAVFIDKRYKPKETWVDGYGHPFQPGSTHYFVGGNTKMYGACLARYRAEDFGAYELEDGISPAWPITYDELAPYYDEAEKIYRVHGRAGADFMEPPRRGVEYPFPPVEHAPVIQRLSNSLWPKDFTPSRFRWGSTSNRVANAFCPSPATGSPAPVMPRAMLMCVACGPLCSAKT